ncbi:unnamed protein product [[Candida] boidinii]|nr:unnamed protein product [[Candida] boidinii]
MPTIPVDKADLYELLGKTYTTEEFDELCFQFGIELDEDTTEDVKGTDERPQLKIEIPANRYDMLCIEGIAQALNEYLEILNSIKDHMIHSLLYKINYTQIYVVIEL